MQLLAAVTLFGAAQLYRRAIFEYAAAALLPLALILGLIASDVVGTAWYGLPLALLGFRDQVVLRFEWETVGNARWSLDAIATRGKTLLAPALAEAVVWLAKEPKGERRLYVVGDGEWLDRDAPELQRRLAEIDAAGVHRAAVFLKDDPPPAALKLFPDHVLATRPDDLRDSLRRSEQAAPDRVERLAAQVSTHRECPAQQTPRGV